jgi:hypothetical protein
VSCIHALRTSRAEQQDCDMICYLVVSIRGLDQKWQFKDVLNESSIVLLFMLGATTYA